MALKFKSKSGEASRKIAAATKAKGKPITWREANTAMKMKKGGKVKKCCGGMSMKK